MLKFFLSGGLYQVVTIDEEGRMGLWLLLRLRAASEIEDDMGLAVGGKIKLVRTQTVMVSELLFSNKEAYEATI